MGLYPGSVDSPNKAKIYGPLPDHGRHNVSLVLHTTETRGMPSFSNGETAPHYVYDPTSRVWTMWAEYEQGAVGTLRGHSRACHGNCQAFQVEILGYTGGEGERQPYVGDFTDDNYRDLAEFYRWAMDRYGIGSDVTPNPPGDWYWSGHRLSCSEWDAFSGLTCHGAVPENTHWDTGVLDLERIHALATEGEGDMFTHFELGKSYAEWEPVVWLLYLLSGGTIDPNVPALDQLRTVLGYKTSPVLVEKGDFDLIASFTGMNAKYRDRMDTDGLNRNGKEIAALHEFAYREG